MKLEPVRAEDADSLARVHGASFDAGWSADDIAALLRADGGFGLAALDDAGAIVGFILARGAADEAEVLTMAVSPACRRQGHARVLVEAAARLAGVRGARSLLLEVAVDNHAAIGLYRAAAFAEVGIRRRYYARAGKDAVDAMVMRRDLNNASA